MRRKSESALFEYIPRLHVCVVAAMMVVAVVVADVGLLF